MNDTYVTLQGWLGNHPTLRDTGSVKVTNFRLASTPRRFQPSTGEWVDGETQWFTVNAWRSLAENCAASLRRGDPVVVHGRLSANTYTNAEGIAVTNFEIEAGFVGHDLTRGTTHFSRRPREAASDTAAEASEATSVSAESVAEPEDAKTHAA